MPSKKSVVTIPSLVDLMQAGAHFGHKKHRSYPTARKYVYTIRDRVLVINLESTRQQLTEACDYLTELARTSATLLFVGTKRQAADLVRQTAEALEQPYVHQRWLGGTLTNFETIQKRLGRLRQLEGLVVSEAFEKDYTKKQRAVLGRELARLERTLGGIKTLARLPHALVIVDTNEESNALTEARRLGIPVIALVDTNADPDVVTRPVVANDDSVRTIELILTAFKEAVLSGRTATTIAKAAEPMAVEIQDAPAEVAEEQPATKKPAAKKTAATKTTKKTK